MPVYKDKKYGTWYSSVYYQDWTGKTKRTTKRGFATRKEAVEWEASFRVKESGDLDMTFIRPNPDSRQGNTIQGRWRHQKQ